MFRNPSVNLYTHDVARLVAFYTDLGFREVFRTPKEGAPAHVEVSLGEFTLGLASVGAAKSDHGLEPDLGGRPFELVLWTEDVDQEYSGLVARGAASLSAPHDFMSSLRAAWVADPDGNPIQLVQKR